MRIRVDERALDSELFLVDVEKRHFVGRFHLRHAEEQDRRAASCKLEGAFHSGVVARALNDDVCAVAADEREEFFVIAVFERVNAQIRAELLCNLAACFVRLAQNDLSRTGKTRKLHEQQADGTAADHAYDVAHLDLRAVDAVQAASKRLAHRAVF